MFKNQYKHNPDGNQTFNQIALLQGNMLKGVSKNLEFAQMQGARKILQHGSSKINSSSVE